MSEALVDKMAMHGYSYWPSCVAEHIVRTGEIRIAWLMAIRNWLKA
jgi:hypothetical protein